MKKKQLLLIVLSIYSAILWAQAPAHYYDAANGKTGYELKSALKNIITDGYVSYSYNDLYTIYRSSDTDSYYENDGTVLDIYSEKPQQIDAYEYTHTSDKCGSYSGEGDCYNREHIVPQSVFGSASPMKSDAHFVVPVDGYVNGRRSNYPFGIVDSPTWTSSNGSKLGPNVTPGYSDTVFEPIDEFKGDIARMLFYFATRYEDQVANWNHPMFDGTSDKVFSDWFLAILLDWNQADPVSQREIDRNNAVYSYQKNRNPFIDHPEWVGAIWGGDSSGGGDGDNGGGNSEVIKIMDFDGTTPEWSFTTNTTFFDNGADGFFGIYNANQDRYDGQPYDTGIGNASDVAVIDNETIEGDFLFVNDLDDEGDNGTSGEAILSFKTIDISKYTNIIFSFDYDMNGFDASDYIKYEIFEDGNSKGTTKVTSNTEGTISVNVSSGTSEFKVLFKIKQNGGADQGAIDNIKLIGKSSDSSSNPECIPVILSLTFDNYPEETSWELNNDSDQTVASGGTYDNESDGSNLDVELCLDLGCYTLNVYDAYGDGMCCNYGNGSYTLVNQNNDNVLVSGGSFQDEESSDFCLGSNKSFSRSKDNGKKSNYLKVYPNPVGNVLNIDINDAKMNSYQIFDISCKIIKKNFFKKHAIDVSDLSSGIYILKLNSYKKTIIRRFIKL